MTEEKAWNKITGKKIATEDFSFTDKKSKPIHKGDIFNIKDIPEKYRSLAASKEYSKVEPGIVRKFISNAFKKGSVDENKLENKSSSSNSIFNESSNKSSNISNTAQNQRSDKSPEYKSQHGSTPSNQSASSINENGKNVNLNS